MLKYLPLIKQNFKISKEDKQKENKFFEKHYRATEEIYKNSIDFNFNKNWNGKGFYEVQCRSSTFEKLKSKAKYNFNIFHSSSLIIQVSYILVFAAMKKKTEECMDFMKSS